MLSPIMMLIMLIAAHFVFDYPLQGDFLSNAKNRFKPIYAVPWYQAMIAHCWLQSAAVAFITGLWWLFIPEFLIHFATDYTKCKGKISFNMDQTIHLGCKVLWWIITLAYFADVNVSHEFVFIS